MCGIAGFIGKSKNKKISDNLISKLFSKIETRGVDASGFWALDENKVFYHKEPIRSSEFIKNSLWQKALNYNLDLVLVHARAASKGVGEPVFNENNHPFTSTDKSIGLIHNGRIVEEEYNLLKQNYELSSKCDSEILLRIYDSTRKYKRLSGIRSIFSLFKKSHMAVAVGEKTSKEKHLWLFRNEHRPLCVIDLKEKLNQIFFVSEPNIWFQSAQECGFYEYQNPIELPTEEIWMFTLYKKNLNRVKVFKINKENKDINSLKYNSIIKRKSSCHVITGLDERDQIKDKNS